MSAARYWRDAIATQEAFGACPAGETDGAYLRTGDLGYLRDGQLYVTGRIKDMVIVRGTKHHGNDLDETICSVSPDLIPGAGAVFGVEDTAGAADEALLVSVHEVGRRAIADLDHASLAAAVSRAVTRNHGIRLDRVVFVREGRLPRTTSGKIQRHLCRAFALKPEQADG